jgi:hypothetical protein
VKGIIWYTLDGPGWRYTGLLERDAEPKPVYIAYQQLNIQLLRTRYVGPVDHGAGVEAYAFSRGAEHVHVIWAVEDESFQIDVPQTKLVQALDRDGQSLTPVSVGGSYQFSVGFEPIYIIRKP